jgi:hypothetical protein
MSEEDSLYGSALDFARIQTEKDGLVWMQPSGSNSGLERHDGVEYAVLRDADCEITAVIRVDNADDEEFTILDPEDYPEELMAEAGEDKEESES